MLVLSAKSQGSGSEQPSGAYTQENRPLEVVTPLGKDVLLLAAFSGTEAVSQLFHFQLDLLAENERLKKKDIAFEDILGKKVSVRLNLAGEESPRFFNGICCRFGQTGRNRVFTSY